MATSFDVLEKSVDSGRPMEFYEFRLPIVGAVWRHVAADEDQVVEGFVWTAAAISRENIQQTGEYVNDALKIDCPNWIGPAQLFMTSAPSYPMTVIISTMHVGSTERLVSWQGEIKQVGFPLPGKARMTCESLSSTFRREGLRLPWQRTCPYMLYDSLTCRLNKEDWGIPFMVLTIDGFDITVDLDTPQDAGYFNGGFIEWAHPIRGKEFLMIESHEVAAGEANAKFLIFGPPGELYEGATGTVYPGCDFTPTTCQSFNNYDNYGGHPDLPGKSPFDGDPVF